MCSLRFSTKKIAVNLAIVCNMLLMQCLVYAQKKILNEPGDSIFTKNAIFKNIPFNTEQPYYVASFTKKIPANITIVRLLDESHAIIEINTQAGFDTICRQIKIAPSTNNWKLSWAAENLLNQNKQATKNIIVTGQNVQVLLAALQKETKACTVLSVNHPSNSVLVSCNTAFVKSSLLPLREIIFIDIAQKAHTETGIVGYDRSFHGLTILDNNLPGANGKNIVVGVKEQRMDATDIDLLKRVLPSPIGAANTTVHATVIASIIGGAGNSFYDGKGIASGCTFFSSSFDNLFADEAVVLNNNKVSVQNHSYGTIVQQFYGAEAVSYDAQTWQNKNTVHIFSAGNRGLSAASDGKYANLNGFANLTGNFKMAKNIITVGAIDNKENIPGESSVGPLYDGRLAPQLIALGPNGTSDASAVVSGTVAVMQQVFADSNSQSLPPSSLVKALLYNTADDVYTEGIDYKTGYGLLNSYGAVQALRQKKYDAGTAIQGSLWAKTLAVPANTAQVKITLAWTDSVAPINNNKALINDLDLELIEIATGTVYKPWVLNAFTNIDSLKKIPTRKRDSLNTAEQVSVQLPAAGNYEIRVTGTTIAGSSLPFNVAFSTDTLNTFAFISPVHAADVNKNENENLVIRWRTFVADTNQTGNLYISYNSGTNWLLLQQNHKLYINKYTWKIKDTSTTAILKMETPFGNFLSANIILGNITRLAVDFDCADSFRISWPRHLYAGSYRIYCLTDSPYLKPIVNTADTFAVLKKSQFSSVVYAVEPVLTNGIAAARSSAVNVAQQGVQCFYRAFNYDVLTGNKLNLELELSIATYVDSIFFEGVTQAGQLINIFGTARVANNELVYSQLTQQLPAGITYVRARLKLKTGNILYTEILNILTSGSRYIVFYPNPSRASTPLRFVVQQGLPVGSHLQLYDISGRLLKNYASIPDAVNTAALSAGIIIYKIVSSKGKVLETGKFLIQ